MSPYSWPVSGSLDGFLPVSGEPPEAWPASHLPSPEETCSIPLSLGSRLWLPYSVKGALLLGFSQMLDRSPAPLD